MSISAGLAAFKLSFQLSPIILTGGIATNIPGGMLPIVAITEALNFTEGLLSGGDPLSDLDDFFANFWPVAGGTLIDQVLGEYPFANQAVAANAVITQPLVISLRMVCPARGEAGYGIKLATMMGLQATIAQHNASGGTYTVVTPSFFYTNCVHLRLYDTSNTASKQAQNTYQWDFRRPLLTLQDAQQAQNNLMSQISNGTAISGAPSWSGLGPTTGNPASLGAIGTIPAAQSPVGASAASPTAGFGHA
jgi:hypothetical protein